MEDFFEGMYNAPFQKSKQTANTSSLGKEYI